MGACLVSQPTDKQKEEMVIINHQLQTKMAKKQQLPPTASSIPPPQNYDLTSETQPIIIKKPISWLSNREEQDDSFEADLQRFVRQVFEQYDLDRSGTLDLSQFGRLLRQSANEALRNEEVQKLLNAIDSDSNKKVSCQQLMALYKKLIR